MTLASVSFSIPFSFSWVVKCNWQNINDPNQLIKSNFHIRFSIINFKIKCSLISFWIYKDKVITKDNSLTKKDAKKMFCKWIGIHFITNNYPKLQAYIGLILQLTNVGVHAKNFNLKPSFLLESEIMTTCLKLLISFVKFNCLDFFLNIKHCNYHRFQNRNILNYRRKLWYKSL